MKVTVTSRSLKLQEEYDYRNKCEISIDGEEVFSVFDDEPEDSNLNRTFSPVWDIPNLMRKAFIAGSKGEDFVVEETLIEEDDE
tara:strand:- start:2390 stop:2641 length:252 start_codon:yes stop_codon:yes gene_type:complete